MQVQKQFKPGDAKLRGASNLVFSSRLPEVRHSADFFTVKKSLVNALGRFGGYAHALAPLKSSLSSSATLLQRSWLVIKTPFLGSVEVCHG